MAVAVGTRIVVANDAERERRAALGSALACLWSVAVWTESLLCLRPTASFEMSVRQKNYCTAAEISKPSLPACRVSL